MGTFSLYRSCGGKGLGNGLGRITTALRRSSGQIVVLIGRGGWSLKCVGVGAFGQRGPILPVFEDVKSCPELWEKGTGKLVREDNYCDGSVLFAGSRVGWAVCGGLLFRVLVRGGRPLVGSVVDNLCKVCLGNCSVVRLVFANVGAAALLLLLLFLMGDDSTRAFVPCAPSSLGGNS